MALSRGQHSHTHIAPRIQYTHSIAGGVLCVLLCVVLLLCSVAHGISLTVSCKQEHLSVMKLHAARFLAQHPTVESVQFYVMPTGEQTVRVCIRECERQGECVREYLSVKEMRSEAVVCERECLYDWDKALQSSRNKRSVRF